MSRWGKLAYLVRAGALLMCIGNLLVMCLQFDDAGWKYFTFVIPASLGQGIVYPGILFTFLAIFDHAGVFDLPNCQLVLALAVDGSELTLQTTRSQHRRCTSSAP